MSDLHDFMPAETPEAKAARLARLAEKARVATEKAIAARERLVLLEDEAKRARESATPWGPEGKPSVFHVESPPCVYFLRDKNSNLVKIGFTTDLKTRLQALRTGVDCELVGLIPFATQELERALHESLSPWRAHGEWFRSGQPYVEKVIAAAQAIGDLLLMMGVVFDRDTVSVSEWSPTRERERLSRQFIYALEQEWLR